MTPCLVSGDYPFEALHDHFWRAREEAVRMGVVGRPQDLVRSDIVGQHLEAALDRLERDPAIAPEELARARREPGIVEPLIVEMSVHPVEPGRDPAPPDSRKAMRIFG